MSTVILQKDYEGKKAGEKISVPFGKGRDMLRDGVAIYAPSAPITPKVSPAKPEGESIEAVKQEAIAAMKKNKAEAIAAMKQTIAECEAKIAKAGEEVKAANDEAKQAFEMADKATAENAELKKQIEDMKKPKGAK